MDSESTLQGIWDKWIYLDFPTSLQNDCSIACEPIREFLFDLLEINFKAGNLDRSESYRHGEHVGEITAIMSTYSVMLGLEYGLQERNSEITISLVREKSKEALPLLRIASDSITKYSGQLISGAKAVDKGVSNNLENLVRAFGRTIIHASFTCFHIGMLYSKEI